jgi:chromosomal replication initiation ATPase DnaA
VTPIFLILEEVQLVFSDDMVKARNVKMYLCRRYTGEILEDIGLHFGIGETSISKAGRRVA